MLKLFPLHQQHRVKQSLNCFGDAEQHKESERKKNNAWERERNSWIRKGEKR